MTRLYPANIQHIGTEMAISWSDGTESFIPLDLLRRSCPCAMCQGEPDVTGKVIMLGGVRITPESMELKSWGMVGGYAWQPAWRDGHDSGLYPFTLLKKLGEQALTGVNSDAEPEDRI